MAKTKQMRTGRPARQSARPAQGLTVAWHRIAELPDKLREERRKEEAAQEAKNAAWARIKPTRGDKACERWFARNRRTGTMSPEVLAKKVKLPVALIIREAKAAGALVDFGRSAFAGGWRLRYVQYRKLAAFAADRLKAVAA